LKININKNTNKNIGMKRSLVIAGALVTTAIVLTLALGGIFAQDAFADSAISGKINFLPWEGTGGILVLLPPAYSGMGTTIPLAPALVSPTFTNV
jgi:hypothetical protein